MQWKVLKVWIKQEIRYGWIYSKMISSDGIVASFNSSEISENVVEVVDDNDV